MRLPTGSRGTNERGGSRNRTVTPGEGGTRGRPGKTRPCRIFPKTRLLIRAHGHSEPTCWSTDDRLIHFRRGCEEDQAEHPLRAFVESRSFYNGVIGLDGGYGLDWILFFGTDQEEVQLSVMKLDIKAHVHPAVSIEVDDFEDVYARALAAGADIVYPITEEEWGLRRFFVRDPDGPVINVTEHRET